MPSSIHHYTLMILFFVLEISVSSAAKYKRPKPTALLFPISKDTKTLQYYTTLDISKQENSVQLVLDLGGPHTWLNCDANELRRYKSIRCGSQKCAKYNTLDNKCCNRPFTPGCTKGACAVYSYNAYIFGPVSLGLREDALFAVDTNGVSAGAPYQAPKPFPFTCSDSDLLRGLANGTKGMTGIANTTTSLPAQITTQFELPHKFALCMPSTSEYAPGHMFVGRGPYFFPPYLKDIANELIKTQLVVNPLSTAPVYHTGDPSYDYFINVKSIKVDHKPISFNSSLLFINEEGYGGTTFSTLTPFTKLDTSIYESLVSAFTKAAALRKMKRVSSVAPFGACYKAKSVARSQTGPVVPYIDIGLAGSKKDWRFYGVNSMVSVNEEVLCLAFVDIGQFPRTSIVIGGHQMENYLLEFDLDSSNLGISTSLLLQDTTCSQSREMQ
ncbi:Xyloglucan-specific endoglucanase inhibitor protein 2 [Heracleum sosnowskyi]|uniref:Xyloglucan-specific endoglucanase inhibitor protein 2 n=1 Tax=Heracleum sosnowskyi TaxID=360622 RepID=A0AAD8HR87_9APIA|nr:Xyloglucan-specific endoglucanase inhibitor protein 2 [Heracleum sosnowskyi]